MINIKELKPGDPIFWNEGNSYFKGNFVKLGKPILELDRVVYGPNEEDDCTLAIFLIPEEKYNAAMENKNKVKVRKIRVDENGNEIVKEKSTEPSANLKGVAALLEKEGLTIIKGDRWYRYNISGKIIDYRGPIKDVFNTLKTGGVEAVYAMHQEAPAKEKSDKVTKDYEPKANIKGLQYLLNKEGIEFEKTGEKWFRYSYVRDGKKGTFDYRGPIKHVFDALTKKGIEKMFALNQFED